MHTMTLNNAIEIDIPRNIQEIIENHRKVSIEIHMHSMTRMVTERKSIMIDKSLIPDAFKHILR
jgi:hypothetical protein